MKTALKILGGIVAFVLVAFLGIAGYAHYQVGRTYPVPRPAIQRATSPEALERGSMIVHSTCVECHAGDDSPKLIGRTLVDFPAFMGKFHSANITQDPVAGVGAWSDEELAGFLKTGIGRDGRLHPMPILKDMGDADIAAILGYLRSPAPELAADSHLEPASTLTLPGSLIFGVMMKPSSEFKTGIPTPPKAPTAAYGRYLVTGLFDCYGCHTPGYTMDKLDKPGFLGGGMAFRHDDGSVVYSANLTFDPSGLSGYTVAELGRAVRQGIARDGTVLRPPMPRMRYLDDDDIAALYAYLQTVPKVSRALEPDAAPRPKPSGSDPEQLFAQLGCVTCHGPTGAYRSKLRQAVGKATPEVASWILNPERIKPGTQMPTFAEVLKPADALTLAQWVQGYAAKLPR